MDDAVDSVDRIPMLVAGHQLFSRAALRFLLGGN